jgi:transposase
MNGKRQAEWRKNQVLELSSKGLTQSDIAKILQISISTIVTYSLYHEVCRFDVYRKGEK